MKGQGFGSALFLISQPSEGYFTEAYHRISCGTRRPGATGRGAIGNTMENLNNDVTQCPGSFTAASQSDLRTADRAFCSECGQVVFVWLEDGEWHRCGHHAGSNADEAELARLVKSGVRAAAISPDYDPAP